MMMITLGPVTLLSHASDTSCQTLVLLSRLVTSSIPSTRGVSRVATVQLQISLSRSAAARRPSRLAGSAARRRPAGLRA